MKRALSYTLVRAVQTMLAALAVIALACILRIMGVW